MGSQTFLAIGAIAIFMYNALNLNRTTVNATKQTVNQQHNIEAVNVGQDLVDLMYSQAANYDNVETLYGDYDDETNPSRRMDVETATEETLYATFDFSAEQEILHGVNGKIITITVYREIDDTLVRKAQYTVPLNEQ
jgi:hypothetical protein